MPRRGPSSGTYGKACINCSKCKCRCVTPPGGDACERCHRLGKKCEPVKSLPRRNTVRNQDRDARIAELEGKLGGLVSLLQSRNVLDSDTGMLAQQRIDVDTLDVNAPDSPGETESTTSTSNAETIRPQRITVSPVPFAIVGAHTWGTAELDRFRSGMLHFFPFINLPGSLTAQRLKTERPLLFEAILCVACASAYGRRERAVDLRRLLAEAAFIRQSDETGSDSTMDLLLALLVYIAWGWDHVYQGGGLTRLMALAMSLVGELRLDKPISSDARALQIFSTDIKVRNGVAEGQMLHESVLERQRALLGCFILSCFVSTYSGGTEPLRWTPKMEAALEALVVAENCPADAVLVLQVRLQLLSMRAAQIRGGYEEAGTTLKAKHIAPLLRQLRELRPSMPDAGPEHSLPATATMSTRILMAHSQYAEMDIISTLDMHPVNATSGQLPIDSLSYFRQSLFAIEKCTAGLLAVPVSQFLGISFLQWVQLSRCAVVLHHLTTLSDRWNLAAVREIVHLPVLLDHMVEKLEQAAQEAGEQEETDVFTQIALTTRKFSSSLEASIVHPAEDQSTEKSPGSATAWAPQKGYFRNPRFWLDNHFDTGYSWGGLGTSNALVPPLWATAKKSTQVDTEFPLDFRSVPARNCV